MNLISVENLSKSQADKVLFEKINFGIGSGDKIALIGNNGSGKSSFLKILAGIDNDYDGTVVKNKGLIISYLSQVVDYDLNLTIVDYILASDSPKFSLLREYEICLELVHKENNSNNQKKLAEIIDKMDNAGTWDYENQFKSLLSELDINNTSLKLGELSGGMLKKVELARVLVQDADLLLFDEPTNHLDINTINWLEQYLIRCNKSILLVTHDRYFLDKICSSIYEISSKSFIRYNGSYSYFMKKKADMDEVLKKEQSRIQNIMRRELAWLKKGVKARATKQKARKERAINLIKNSSYSNEEKSSNFMVEERRQGKKILEIKDVVKVYGNSMIISSFSKIFKKGDRVGVIGANGSGKTTLLKLILGRERIDSGDIEVGSNTCFGFFDQLSLELDPNKTVLNYLKDEAEHIKKKDGSSLSVSQLLEKFLFNRNMFNEPIGKLSGGERRRLQLIRVLLNNPNFLVFDEPTNDLDIQTLSLLEEFLLDFNGCVIVVSHDRYFLDRVVNDLLIINDRGIIESFPGNYSEYLEQKNKQTDKSTKDVKLKEKNKLNLQKKKGLSFNEKKEYQLILDEIDRLEEEKSNLEKLFLGNFKNDIDITEASNRYKELEKELEIKINRWEELASKDIEN